MGSDDNEGGRLWNPIGTTSPYCKSICHGAEWGLPVKSPIFWLESDPKKKLLTRTNQAIIYYAEIDEKI